MSLSIPPYPTRVRQMEALSTAKTPRLKIRKNNVEPNKRVKHEFRATEDSVLVIPF